MNKINDAAVIIPVYISNNDRLRNLKIVLQYLNTIFEKECIFIHETIVGEQKVTPEMVDLCTYTSETEINFTCFNKCKSFNTMIDKITTDTVFAHDVDVLLPVQSYHKTLRLLRNGYADVVYPYDGRFYDVPDTIIESLTIDIKSPIDLKLCTLFNPASWGGCVAFKTDTLREGGRFNPNFKGWGYEDDEVRYRFSTLGYRIVRVEPNSPLMHLHHERSNETVQGVIQERQNLDTLHRLTSLSVAELKEHIQNNYSI